MRNNPQSIRFATQTKDEFEDTMPHPEPPNPDLGPRFVERKPCNGLLLLPTELHIEILSYLSFEDQLRAGLAYDIWEQVAVTTKSLKKTRYYAPLGGIRTKFFRAGYLNLTRETINLLPAGGVTCVVEDGVIRRYKLGTVHLQAAPDRGLSSPVDYSRISDPFRRQQRATFYGSYLDVNIDIPRDCKFLDEPITLEKVASTHLSSQILQKYGRLKQEISDINLLDNRGSTISVRQFLNEVAVEINYQLDTDRFGRSSLAYELGVHFNETDLGYWAAFVIPR
ncbi:hypothetical protein H072_473 [Dactylellina haptotyla CBS 200.50]|uniref:F-box domain-containing protein n=1 Tax=Dactylellina haptotyla (strain CBS 200.50) TaxID=1284197 RepID=S8CD22_DACHA|nr:hypothetical protein H072_473 [Dactylellina haptotyla CBS 200.50]